jgi:lysophospholipase L1-like esterase
MNDELRILSRRRTIAYAAIAISISLGVVVLLLAAADVYAHRRTQHVAGVNVWGYRGAPVGGKAEGEIRAVMLGGSTAFGWGLPAHESIPAFLERKLNASGTRRYSVVNLGAPGQGAYGLRFDLSDYEDLRYDLVLVYQGYNDLGPYTIRKQENYFLWRRASPVFRWTGYYPILPTVLREKADAMLARGVQDGRPRFEPGMATRAAAGAMRAAAALTAQLGGRPTALAAAPSDAPAADQCGEVWARYCGSVRDAVDYALAGNRPVIVISQPSVSDAHVDQQAHLAAMLRARYRDDARVKYVDLGRAVDMSDPSLAYDGLHLVAAGNEAIAAQLVGPVLEMSQ